jgi:hypothetical protein
LTISPGEPHAESSHFHCAEPVISHGQGGNFGG